MAQPHSPPPAFTVNEYAPLELEVVVALDDPLKVTVALATPVDPLIV
jgi:hypothetical protein